MTVSSPSFSFAILYIMTSRASLRLSSRLYQFKCSHVTNTKHVSPSVGDISCSPLLDRVELINFAFILL